MAEHWDFNEIDAAAAAEVASFLPDNLFDAHAHLYRLADLDAPATSFYAQGPDQVDAAAWRARLGRQVGEGRLAGALFMPVPLGRAGVARGNAFLLEQLATQPGARGAVVAPPDADRDALVEIIGHPQVVGLKPYHVFSAEQPTFQSSVGGFAPAWIWALADEHELVIVLHLVRDRALADPGVQRELRDFCRKYPRARLQLAHAARGFHAPNTVAGVRALADLDNVWFDASAVCEAEPLLAILDRFGPRRLLWGSDFPVSEQAGRCVTVGDSFSWINPDHIDVHADSPECHAVRVGIESLRALRRAARIFGLDDADLRDIFHDNAARLYGLAAPAGDLTQQLYAHARERIPGGVQLLSKRPEQFAPRQWPAYFREARGCEVWDLDDRHYYDLSFNGIGACLLGYRDPDVTRAVVRRVNLGSMATLNPPEEVELADLLCAIHPWAERVRFARTGGEIAAVAARIARATTGRSHIAICGYHGWHDWYLAANLGESDALRGHLLPGLDPTGVPSELRGTTHAFAYNSRAEFQAILDAHGPRLAAVVMEPCRYREPEPGFLEFVRDAAHRAGALLVFDEITIGWRWALGGGHLRLGVAPDLAIFAKALGNGHPIAAVIGRREAMEGAHTSFISSTYWTESVGPAAALATVRKFQAVDVRAHVARIGALVQERWRASAAAHRLPVAVDDAFPCLAHFRFDHPEADALRTLYTQEMLARGFLAGPAIYPTLAHTDDVVARYGAAIDEVFGEIAAIVAAGDVHRRLNGPVAHSGFRRLL